MPPVEEQTISSPGAPDREDQPPPTIPKYKLFEKLGAGGFGQVYRARHEVIDREVAIKILHARYSFDKTAIARFMTEAKAVNKIAHRGIVQTHDVDVLDGGRPYVVMELLRGTTLRERLTEGAIPLAEAVPLLRQIAEAVDAAHAVGIAHRDLKPDNVFVVADGTVKLIDFGLAKIGNDVTVTQAGSVFGTPLYMSPEQCRGRGTDHRTDAYSFGVLAYHVLTGTTPFSGDSLELALHHLNDAPEPPSKRVPEIGDRGDRVVLALLAKDPAQRPLPLVSAVDAITEGDLPPRPGMRSRRPWIVGGIAAVVLGGATFVVTRGPEPLTMVSDCPNAKSKLTGVWDPIVRARGQARYAAVRQPLVDTTWRVESKMFDDYAEQWGRQWEAACAAPDREIDRLLYAQRLTCLENALVAFHGTAIAAVESDPAVFSAGFIGTPYLNVLEDCEQASVLRAQAPAPSAEKRDEVVRILIDVQRARNDARSGLNAELPELADAGLARLKTDAERLDKLEVPDAAIAWFWFAHYVTPFSADLAGHTELHRADQARAVARAKAAHNDQILVEILADQLRSHTLIGTDDEIDRSLAALTEAVDRAGSPLRGRWQLLRLRADVELGRHQVDRAIADLEAAGRIARVADPGDQLTDRRTLAAAYARADRIGDALAVARAAVREADRLWGKEHRFPLFARLPLVEVELQAGHLSVAREVNAEIRAGWLRLSDSRRLVQEEGVAAQLAYLDGDVPAAELHVSASGPTAYQTLLQAAMKVGNLEMARWAVGHLATEELSAAQSNLVWFQLAATAFMAGDLVAMREAVARRTSDGTDHDWPSVVTDAFDGHLDRVRARLVGWREPTMRWWLTGVVARIAKDWKAAEAAFSEAWRRRAQRQPDECKLATDLGEARVELGQSAAAIPILEIAIDDCLTIGNGLQYSLPFARFALARALWETKGNKTRAGTLAKQARDGFARLGKGRDEDRVRAIRWIADHSLE